MNVTAIDPAARHVLAQYSDRDRWWSVESLRGAGGFSGAEFWRVAGDHRVYCLRRWPREHPSQSRLEVIHRVLRGVHERQVVEVAVPIPARTGHSIVTCAGSLWELAPWMPGVADYHRAASPAKLHAALRLLARFHLAAAEITPLPWGRPAGLTARTEQLRRLLAGGFSELQRARGGVKLGELLSSCFAHDRRAGPLTGQESLSQESLSQEPLSQEPLSSWVPGIGEHLRQFESCFPILAPRILQELERASRERVPLQPCIRDVWHDHVLFTGELVTGLVDFGSLREDHVAADISRLLGSLVGDDRSGWSAGLAAYEQLRPLSPLDRQLISVYDHSGLLLSAMNWLQWFYADRRVFEDAGRVCQRCSEIAARLVKLAGG